MAIVANKCVAKMWSIILQMVFLIQWQQAMGVKVKREPYSVQEMSHGFSSGGDTGGYSIGGSWSGGFGGDSGGGHFIKNRGSFGIGSGGFISSHIADLSSFEGMHDSGSSGSFGHVISGGNDVSEISDEAKSKIKAILLESSIQRKIAEEKVQKMLKEFGYGTFGYPGYEYPIKPGPIDLGTHHAVDLGTTLDADSIKDSNGKLKLPVQTVYITKTVGVPIPEPYPIKHEVPVPAPYPVPVPTHYSDDSYSNSYSSDYSSNSGKSSYNSDSSLSKVVQYHENLPKSTEKDYASASTNYLRYLPSSTSSAYRSALIPTHYAPKQSVYEFQ